MNSASETRKVSGFKRLELSETVNWVDLVVEPGEPERLTIEGPPEYIARVKSWFEAKRSRYLLPAAYPTKLEMR